MSAVIEGAVVISGRMGAGKSTLLRAVLEVDPDAFRCLTLTTTRPPRQSDVMHPRFTHWSEFCYVSYPTFRWWLDNGHLTAAVSDDDDYGYGLLNATVMNALEFNGCVIANVPVSYFASYLELFALYRRSVTGIFVDVEDDLLYDRMLRRGATPEHAHENLRKSVDWPEKAAELGYTFIQNPDEEKGYPRKAVAQLMQAIRLH